MVIASTAASVITAVAMLFFAVGEAVGLEPALRGLRAVRFPLSLVWLLVVALVAGAAGLVVGIWWAPAGIAASLGLCLFFLGAVGAHVRVRDWAGAVLPTALLLVVTATLVLIIWSL